MVDSNGADSTAAEPLSLLDGMMSLVGSPTGRIAISGLLLIIGIFLLLPPRGRGRAFPLGAWLVAFGMMGFLFPSLARLPTAPVFFLLEGLAVLGGLGTICSRNPVYSAIWFASSLLAVGALMLITGAQFLGLATVAVYAGAIVVTLLFVLMLAQPAGHALYDRLSWGWFPAWCATAAGTLLVTVVSLAALRAGAISPADQDLLTAVTHAVAEVRPPMDPSPKTLVDSVRKTVDPGGNPVLLVTLHQTEAWFEAQEAVVAAATRKAAGDALSPACRIVFRTNQVLGEHHVARFGGELFGRQLVAVQVAGILLLAALVGAIAMAIHGKDLAANVQRVSRR